MISIPTVWDANLAPPGHHAIHAYTLEPYAGWEYGEFYQEKKRARAQSLFQALEKIYTRCAIANCLKSIGTPLTHARFLRRYQGTYEACNCGWY